MEELAHSVNIILTKGKVPYVASFDNSKPKGQKISLADLPDEDIKAFINLFLNGNVIQVVYLFIAKVSYVL